MLNLRENLHMSKFKGNKKEYGNIIFITLFLVGVFLATNVTKHLNHKIYNQNRLKLKQSNKNNSKQKNVIRLYDVPVKVFKI